MIRVVDVMYGDSVRENHIGFFYESVRSKDVIDSFWVRIVRGACEIGGCEVV